MRRGSGMVVAAVGIAVLVACGLGLPVYWVYLLSTVAVSALIARSIGVVTNQAGLITLCQMSFAAIGGWVVSWIALTAPGLPFPLLVLGGGVAVMPVGLILGAVTARIRGVELAVVTLGFAAALDLVLRQGAFPGVGSGTPVIPAAPFDDPRWYFALCWIVFVVLQLGLRLLGRAPAGLGWIAIRSSERAAAALGVRVVRSKALAFGSGALLAGVAGGLLAGQYGLLTPDVFSPLTSLVYLATAVLCGASLAGGALLAGIVTVFVPEALRRLGLPLDLGNALLAIGAFDVLRRGNGGIAEQVRAKAQDRAFRHVRTTCDLGRMDPDSPPSVTAAAASEPGRGPGDEPPRAVLTIAGLSVSYGANLALDAVNLSIASGDVHALIGPNGAGKTTLVDAVSGFLPEYRGTVRLDGAPIDDLAARDRARLGLRRTFQQLASVEEMTVQQYLELAEASGRAAARQRDQVSERRAWIDDIRERFGLPDGNVPIRLMDTVSRRVLDVAGALVARPRVLLLDEPAAGLAEAGSLALAARVRQIPVDFDCAVLLIEHDMAFVRAASTRATVLDDGRVIATGSVADVVDDPKVIAAYLDRVSDA